VTERDADRLARAALSSATAVAQKVLKTETKKDTVYAAYARSLPWLPGAGICGRCQGWSMITALVDRALAS
jgi:hypothetical protein